MVDDNGSAELPDEFPENTRRLDGTAIHIDRPEGGFVQLSIPAATVLLEICDLVTAKGSQQKFRLAIAQMELEKGLEALNPAPPPNRAERRRQQQSAPAAP